MAQRKIPMRKDIVTGEMKPKKELVRVVKNKENEVSIDPTGKKAGRGAYIHLDVKTAEKARNCSEMENRQKVLQSLGLARRAKKLTTGIDLVIDQVRLGKAYLVFCANDAGQSTKKKITDKCNSYNVTCSLEFTRDELSAAIGSKRSIIAVTDAGFAKKFKQLLSL